MSTEATDEIDALEAELQALEQKAMMGSNGGDGESEDFSFDTDVSGAVDTYAVFKEEDWYPLEIVKIKRNAKNNQMLDVQFSIAAGPRRNKKIFDGIMMSGDGAFRFKALGSAVGMYNHTTGRVTGSAGAMLGQKLWGFISYEAGRTDKNNPDKVYKERNRIRFSDPFKPETFQAWPSDSVTPVTGDIVDPFAENEVAEQAETVEETTHDVVEEAQATEQESDVEATQYIGEDISADETAIPDGTTEVSEETTDELHPETEETESGEGETSEESTSEEGETEEVSGDDELASALEETTDPEVAPEPEPVVVSKPVVQTPKPTNPTPKSTTPAPVVTTPKKPATVATKPAESETPLPWNDEKKV